MLKIEAGRRRASSFSVVHPITPAPTPSSSLVESFVRQTLCPDNGQGEELLRAAEQLLLRPGRLEAREEGEEARVKGVTTMCSQFLLGDEQLQQIEERMVMEVILLS